jgi:hypothetical protein
MQELSKSNQLSYRQRIKKYKRQQQDELEGVGIGKEDVVQDALDRLCQDLMLCYIRIPDNVWITLKKHMSTGAFMEAVRCMAGRADTLLQEKITDKYTLGLNIECKSKDGKLHGRQIDYSKKIPYNVTRNHDKTVEIIQKYLEDSKKISEILKNNGF